LSAEAFLDMLLYCANRQESSSLSFQSVWLSVERGVTIKKQSLDERFNGRAVEFVKSVLMEFMEGRYRTFAPLFSPKLLSGFNHVRIKDSTKFAAPQQLAKNYKGYGGNAGEAGIGIQYEYDVKSGKTLDLSIAPSSRNDREDARNTAGNVEKNDLIIRDLGYFSTSVFDTFSKHEAYFLSRLDAVTHVIEAKSRKRIAFDKLYKEMQKEGIALKEMQVLIGGEAYFPVRLIVQIVPDAVYQQRVKNRKEANKHNNRKKHRETSPDARQETKARYHFSLYITNAEKKLLPAKEIPLLYHLRWQIELCFKSWKGIFHVNNIHPMKEERYMCLLYAKLLLIFIDQQIIYKVQETLYEHKKKTIQILSLSKAFKTLHAFFPMIMKLCRAGRKLSHKMACKIQEIFLADHWLEKRKNKLSLSDIFDLFI
jgi:hypothetical protein